MLKVVDKEHLMLLLTSMLSLVARDQVVAQLAKPRERLARVFESAARA